MTIARRRPQSCLIGGSGLSLLRKFGSRVKLEEPQPLKMSLSVADKSGVHKLTCISELRQRHPKPTAREFELAVLSRYVRGRGLTAGLLIPDDWDWISEFCDANHIPAKKAKADRDEVRLVVRPSDEGQALTLIEALVRESVWTYNGDEVTLLFRKPTASTGVGGLDMPATVIPICDGYGFVFAGRPEHMEEVRELIEQTARGFSPPVVLKPE